MDTYSELVADTTPATGSMQPKPTLEDALRYKDAIIYQVHVKAFYDSNDDGIGNFRGLTEKSDECHMAYLGSRPDWVRIPIAELLGRAQDAAGAS